MRKVLKNFRLDVGTITALESLVGIRGKDQTDVIRTLVLAAYDDFDAARTAVRRSRAHVIIATEQLGAKLRKETEITNRKPRKEKK
jgi:hypothetical protein